VQHAYVKKIVELIDHMTGDRKVKGFSFFSVSCQVPTGQNFTGSSSLMKLCQVGQMCQV